MGFIMKIESSDMNLSSEYSKMSFNYEKIEFRIFSSENEKNKASEIQLNVDYIKLDVKQVNLKEKSMDENELKVFIIRFFVEKLTGKKVKLLSMEDYNKISNPESNVSIPEIAGELKYEKISYEKEDVYFKAHGKVITKDGREIKFDINFSLNREMLDYTKLDLKFGSAALVDPLIINLDGNLEDVLSDSKFSFDLNVDGEDEKISLLKPGNGFLVFDKNHNGKVDNGSELFGAKTGYGFKELKQFDEDKNNWIDENDSVFNNLKLWIRNQNEDRLLDLKNIGIGAIYLNNELTPFTFDNKGKLQKSSIYLKESGDVGVISKVDFLV